MIDRPREPLLRAPLEPRTEAWAEVVAEEEASGLPLRLMFLTCYAHASQYGTFSDAPGWLADRTPRDLARWSLNHCAAACAAFERMGLIVAAWHSAPRAPSGWILTPKGRALV